MIVTIATVLGFGKDAQAGGGAFVGGMIAGHVVSGAVNRSKERTQAAEYAAYSQPSTQQTSSTKTTEQKLDELRLEHRDLDDVIHHLNHSAYPDQLQIQRLKKRKLRLKDNIERVESRLIPDIDA